MYRYKIINVNEWKIKRTNKLVNYLRTETEEDDKKTNAINDRIETYKQYCIIQEHSFIKMSKIE